MNSFLNRLREKFFTYIAWFFAILIVAITFIAGETLYNPKISYKRGYEIKISDDGVPVIAKKEEVDIEKFMRMANVKNGEKIFKKCSTCHNIIRGGANKVGPNLFGVVGRKQGSYPGFKYSDDMKSIGGRWGRRELNLFLTKPKKYIKGTKMGFAGLRKPQDRADIISYLESNR